MLDVFLRLNVHIRAVRVARPSLAANYSADLSCFSIFFGGLFDCLIASGQMHLVVRVMSELLPQVRDVLGTLYLRKVV